MNLRPAPGVASESARRGIHQWYEDMYRGQLRLNVVINKLVAGIGRLSPRKYALGAEGGDHRDSLRDDQID